MIKNFLICCICLISFSCYTQNGTVSTYSFFGIGESRDNGTVENQMMGGLQMYADSIHINLRNPAAYSELLLTTYTGAISNTTLRLKEVGSQENVSVATFDYIAIGLPIAKKTAIGFGLKPFSSVGYSIATSSQNAAQDTISTLFSGEGGINTAFLSIGFQPIKNLSIGASVKYNFGIIDYQRIQSIQNVQFGTRNDRESRVSGYDFDFAVNYRRKIGSKYTLISHIGVDTQVNLVSRNSEQIGSFSTSTGADIETTDVDLRSLNLSDTELKIPTNTVLGAGFGEERKWFLGAEYSFQQLNSFENSFLRIDNVRYDNAQTVAFGGYFIPNYSSFSGYFSKITYRAGIRYEETGLIVNDREINNFGITFGFGLPLGGINPSNVNLGFELGRRGTTAAGLVEESRLKINLGISLNDKWFRKRKIN